MRASLKAITALDSLTTRSGDERAMTEGFEPIILSGSDRRLESEIEFGRDEALHFQAPEAESKLALYGPYASLPAGHYRLELRFSISERASGNISVELYRPQTVLYSRIVFPWEVERGFISISYPFEHAIQNLEIRLRVPPRCEGSIKQLSIQQQAKD